MPEWHLYFSGLKLYSYFVSLPPRAAWPFALVMVFSNSAIFWPSFDFAKPLSNFLYFFFFHLKKKKEVMCSFLGCCEFIFRAGTVTEAWSTGGSLLMNDLCALHCCAGPPSVSAAPRPFPGRALCARSPGWSYVLLQAVPEPVPRKLCPRVFRRSFLTNRADFVSSDSGITKM